MKYRASDPSCKWSQACCAAHGGGIRACARACPGAGEECGPLLPPGARGEKSLTGAVAGGDAGAAEREGDDRSDGPHEMLRTSLRGSGQASAAARRVAPDRSAGGAGPLGGPGGGGATGLGPDAGPRWRRRRRAARTVATVASDISAVARWGSARRLWRGWDSAPHASRIIPGTRSPQRMPRPRSRPR